MNKKIIVGVVILILAVVAGVVAVSTLGKKEAPKKVAQQTEQDVIPTVDASTTVELKQIEGKKEIELVVSGIPKTTSAIDYELSYETKQQGTQGVIGTISTITGSGFTKQITLGTCSSGRCVYHEVVGAIHITLKFTGDYGQKVLEKEISL